MVIFAMVLLNTPIERGHTKLPIKKKTERGYTKFKFKLRKNLVGCKRYMVLFHILPFGQWISFSSYFPGKKIHDLCQRQHFTHDHLIIGLYKLLLEYLVVRAMQIGRMYCL